MDEIHFSLKIASLPASFTAFDHVGKAKSFQSILAGMHIPAPAVPATKLPGIKPQRTVRTAESPAQAANAPDTSSPRTMPNCSSTAKYWY